MRLIFSILLVGCSTLYGQLNTSLLSNLNYKSLHDCQLNDIWGYVDENGNEYALVGATKGTSVVNVSDPANPIEIFWEPGMESAWRDIKTYGDYAYITTEANNGLLIIDLSPLPGSTSLPVYYYNGDGGVDYKRAHNLYIDNGYCFLFGSNVGNGGVQILDVHTDPIHPTIVGEFDNWYCHDGVIQNDTMYLAHIYDGFMSIVDLSDINNPILLGTKTTPSNFAHNIWPSTDGHYAFTTDEVMNGYIGAYDISDPSNMIELDRVQSSPGKNIIPHNAHFINNYVVTSYYSDGITVHDVSHPYNMIEVANYDTYPYQTSNFDGCWGAYPFLPSGIVLASDRQYGLFVLGVNYQRAAYLEGTVTDMDSGLPIDNVTVSIQNWEYENNTNSTGFYATGRPHGGVATVKYEKVGYYPETDNVVLQNGIITTHDVQMIPIPPYNLNVKIYDEATNNLISDASIRFENEYLTHDGITNGIGEEDMTLFYEGVYTVTAGKWGYVSKCEDIEIDQFTGELSIYLRKGYYDDFSFDYGWYKTGSALSGLWTRDIPFGTQENANPDRDAPWDCGNYAYVTGNTHDFNFTIDDVSEGNVQLFSPIMDLTTYSDPHINYFKWFYTRYGDTPAVDSLSIYLLNGSQTVQIDVMKVRPDMDGWVHNSIRVSEYLPVTATMQILVETSDYEPDWNVVEAGFDAFSVSNYNTTSVETIEQNVFKVYPNPFLDQFSVENAITGEEYSILDLNGRVIKKGIFEATNTEIDCENLQTGIYILQTQTATIRLIKN